MAKGKKKQEPPEFINDVVTPPGIAAFCHLAKPDTQGQYADSKYKVRLLIEKGTDFKDFQKKVLILARRKWGKSIKLADINTPWQDGDERDDLDGHADHWYFNLKSKNRPTIVDKKKNDLEANEIYGGCKIRCVISLMTYEGTEIVKVNGKKVREEYKGVTCLLELVQFMGHGEPFGAGNSSAKRELLDDLEDDEDDLDDLEDELDDDDDDGLDDDLDDLDDELE